MKSASFPWCSCPGSKGSVRSNASMVRDDWKRIHPDLRAFQLLPCWLPAWLHTLGAGVTLCMPVYVLFAPGLNSVHPPFSLDFILIFHKDVWVPCLSSPSCVYLPYSFFSLKTQESFHIRHTPCF